MERMLVWLVGDDGDEFLYPVEIWSVDLFCG